MHATCQVLQRTIGKTIELVNIAQIKVFGTLDGTLQLIRRQGLQLDRLTKIHCSCDTGGTKALSAHHTQS